MLLNRLRASAAWRKFLDVVPALAPVGTVAVVFVSFSGMKELAHDRLPIEASVIGAAFVRSHENLESRVLGVAARQDWMTVGFLVVLLTAAAATWSFVMMLKTLRGRRGCRAALTLAVAGVALVAYLTFRMDRLVLGDLLAAELDGLAMLPQGWNMRTTLLWFMAGIFSTTFLVALAVGSALLNPERSRAIPWEPHTLARRIMQVRALMLLVTTWLVAGVVAVAAVYRWPVNLLASDSGKELARHLSALARAEVLEGGMFYSLMLISIFVPAELGFRQIGLALAEDAQPRDPAAQARWLEKAGFGGSPLRLLSRLLATLSPLLAAVTENVVSIRVG